MEPAGRTAEEEPLRGSKSTVAARRRLCATSSAAPRQQATAAGSADTSLCRVCAAADVSPHSTCSTLRSSRKPVSRQEQQRQPLTAISANAPATNTPLAAQLTCASLRTWDGFIACVVGVDGVTTREPNALSSLRFPCRQRRVKDRLLNEQ